MNTVVIREEDHVSIEQLIEMGARVSHTDKLGNVEIVLPNPWYATYKMGVQRIYNGESQLVACQRDNKPLVVIEEIEKKVEVQAGRGHSSSSYWGEIPTL